MARRYPHKAFELFDHLYPHIRISSSMASEWEKLLDTDSGTDVASNPKQWLNNGSQITYFHSGRDALAACLTDLNLKKDDEVLIVTTTNGPYISGCVTKTIEKVCQWKREKTDKTKLVLVIHEFGFPLPFESIEAYQEEGIPILEDNCYSFGTRLTGGKVGMFGDYAIYSLPKYYPTPLGGLLVSQKKISTDAGKNKAPKDLEMILKTTINNAQPQTFIWNVQRRANWEFFAEEIAETGFGPYFQLSENDVPGVYLTKVPKDFAGEDVKKKLTDSGIECTQYYNQGGFYFPVHQFLTDYEKEYILEQFLKK